MSSPASQLRVRRYLWRLTEVAALLALVILFCWLFAWSIPYILPFVIGWLFAVLLLPLVRFLEKRGIRRTSAVTGVLISVILIVLAVSVYSVIAIASEATNLSANIGTYFNQIQTWVTHEIALGRTYLGNLPPKVATGMQDTALAQLSSLESTFKGFAQFLLNSVTNLPDTAFIAVIATITCFFMMLNRERMYQNFLRVLPPGWSVKMDVVIHDMLRAFVGTIRVQFILMLMSAVLGVLGLWILGVEYAFIIGLLIGIFGLVPIIGSALLTVPWAIGAFAVGDISLGLKLLLLQAFISVLRHIVEPKILADSVGLDTLSTLFALYVGMKLLGTLGLFLGPIILIGVKSLLRTRLFVDYFPSTDEEVADVNELEPRRGML